jgi:secreted trypsin-like serine protease
MLNRKLSFKKIVCSVLGTSLLMATASFAHAGIQESKVTPTITAGAPPDSPGARVDPNVSSSKFSGVVSLYIQNGDLAGICSGALVGKRQVVSAGHCVDSAGNGVAVDLNKPGTSVDVVFNSNGTSNDIIRTTKISINPDYAGFGNCPAGVNSFCANDDLAVLTLAKDAPASATIYKIAVNPLLEGQHIIMAGYGTSGDGVSGFNVGAWFDTKRSGENYVDLFTQDDEQGFTGQAEVFYADFDGGGYDTFCNYAGVCTPQLSNEREAGIGGGDSGGPSFVEMYGELMLVANNTFTGDFGDRTDGRFGSYFGGMILGAYTDYLLDATDGNITLVPEPASVTLLGLGGLLLLLGARRRRSRK